jgi:hypothetical protein
MMTDFALDVMFFVDVVLCMAEAVAEPTDATM